MVWRSLIASRSLLKEGSRWIIGNGWQVKIWKDKWLQRSTSYYIQSPISQLHEEARVADLVDHTNHSWKSDLINQLFIPDDVKVISTIPLSIIDRDDKLVWFIAKNGLFSIKSAYHFYHSMFISSRGETSTNRIPKQAWTTIWKLFAFNRTKIFIWRACKEIPPTYQNLAKMRIINVDLCPICHQCVEFVYHAL